MKRNKIVLSFLIVILALIFIAPLTKAQTVTNEILTTQSVQFVGNTVAIQQFIPYADNVAYDQFTTVTMAGLSGLGDITFTADTGEVILTADDDVSVQFTYDSTLIAVLANGVALASGAILSVSNGEVVTFTWGLVPGVNALYPSVLNVQPFWQYFLNGNFIGFFVAIFTWSFIQYDILVGALLALFLVPLYIRTRSLLLLSVIWILLGSIFIIAIPSLSALALVFLVLGIASVLWKLVHPN